MNTKVGVDGGKTKFDAAVMTSQGKYRTKVFDNNPAGFAAFAAWLDAHVPAGRSQAHVCMESTGSYHEALACFLFDAGIAVSVVNPLRVKRFMESEGVRNKTDRGDAKALARFAQKNEPERWEAPAPAVRTLQALVARLDALMEMRQAERNRQEVSHPSVQPSIEAMLGSIDEAIAEVRRQIAATIDDDPDLKRRNELLETIPGLGDRTIPQLLAYIGRPQRFKSVKALTAYACLSPLIRQSGTSLDRHKGTHPTGHHALRSALYFPAMVAGKHNPSVAAFWARLKAQHKPGKVIVVACMHKLLAIVYGVLKSGRPFDAQVALGHGPHS